MARPTERPPADAPARPQGGGPARPPGRAPAPPEPDPVVQQRAWASAALGVLSLLGLSLGGGLRRAPLVVIVTLLIGAAAIWLGGSAIRRAARARAGRPRPGVWGLVLGILGVALSAIMLIGYALFWTQLTAYSNCLSGANTVSAQQACQHQFSQSVTNQLKSWQGAG